MYTGIKLDGVSVGNYETALSALEERCKRSRGHRDDCYPGGGTVPLGHKRSEVTSVRMLRDESIAFKLYRTDVVIWHKDNSVSIDSYPSQTTTVFARCLLPADLSLGMTTMTYFPKTDPLPKYTGDGSAWSSAWSARWAGARICNADGTYVEGPDGWAPVDPDPMSYLTLDRKRAREVSKEYNLRDFRTWMSVAPFHTEIEHRKDDIAFCVEMLKERDFKSACMHLPTPELTRRFGLRDRVKPLPIRGTRWNSPIIMATIERVKDYIYWQEDALTRTTVPTMTVAEYGQCHSKIRALQRVGVYL